MELEDNLDDKIVDNQSLADKLVNSVVDQDFAAAAPTFAELMKTKVDDALEQEKIGQADAIFNNAEEPDAEAEENDDDISDEELDDAIEELDDDDQEAEEPEEEEAEAA